MKIAPGHQGLMPYLILENCLEFIEFTKRVFDAKEIFKSFTDDRKTKIAHAEIQINNCNIMMADVTEDFEVANANIFVYVDDADLIMEIALQNDSEVVTEVADQHHGRSGGFEDPFGNVWWVMAMK